MSFWQKIQKWGVTSRPATPEEEAQLNDAVQAAETVDGKIEATVQESYGYQEYGPGFTEKRSTFVQAPVKKGLFGRIKDRISSTPQVEARHQTIDMVEAIEKPSLAQKFGERISSTSAAVSNSLSNARNAISSAFEKDDTLLLTRDMMETPPPSLLDRFLARPTVRSTIDGLKASGPAFMGGTKAAGQIIGQGIKNSVASIRAASSRTASNVASLPARVAATGRDLANPETRRQTALTLAKATGQTLAVAGSNMALVGGVKLAAGAALAGTGAGATIAGLALATGTVKGLLDSRRQYHETLEGEKGTVKGYWKHVFNNKAQLAKNIGVKTAISAALGGVAGYFMADHVLDQASAVKPNIDPTLVTDADTLKDITSAPEVPVYHASAELNEAIKIVREHGFISEDKIALAQQGDASSIKDIAHAINTDGIRADDHLVKPLMDEAARQADVSGVKDVAPVTTAAPSAPIAAAPTPLASNPHFLDSVISTLDAAAENVTPENATTAAIAVGGTAATTAAVVTAANALPALALSTAPIQQDAVQLREQARVEQVLQMRAQGISLLENNFIGLEKGKCFISNTTSREGACSALESEMQEGDFIRVVGKDTGISTAAYVSAPVGEKVDTNQFMSNLVSVKNTFNTLMQIVSPASTPVAANENEAVAPVPAPVAVSETAPVAIEAQTLTQPLAQELPPVAQTAAVSTPAQTAETAPADEAAEFDEMMKYAPAPPADFEMPAEAKELPPVAQSAAPVSSSATAPVQQKVRDAFAKWSIRLPEGISPNNVPSGNPLTPPAKETSRAFQDAFKDFTPVNDDVLARTGQMAPR